MPLIDVCASLMLSADGVAECRGLVEAPCSTLDTYAGCRGGRSVEPEFHITVQIASVENPLWNPWLALKYAGIASKLREHEFQHVRVFQAFLPSLIVSMRDQETCAAAFTLADVVLHAIEPIHALLDREHLQAVSDTKRR